MLSTGVYVRSATLHEHECRFYYVKPKSEKWKNCDTEPLLTVFCPYPRLLECLKVTHSPNVKTLSVQVWLGQCWNPRRPLSRPALGQVAVFSDEIGDSSVYSRFQAFRFKLWGHHKDMWQWRETQLLALWLSSSLHYEHRPATGWQVLKRRGCKSPDSWKA